MPILAKPKPPLTFLVDAQARHRKYPKTFEVPTPDELAELQPAWHAKVIVNDMERPWVRITSIDGQRFKGTLANEPLTFDGKFGDEVTFEARHICSIAPPLD